MKLFLILLGAAVVIKGFTLRPTQRFRRDVSHLDLHYLSPATNYLPPLTPTIKATLPSNEYLPPVINEKQAETTELPKDLSNEALPLKNEITTQTLPATKEYLPPTVEVKSAEEISEITQPSNEYLPPVQTVEENLFEIDANPETEEELEVSTIAAESTDSAEIVESHTEIIQDTAVLKDDGYHYKIPTESRDILPAREYMLPLEEDVVEVEGPLNGETSTLEEDGYHYRAIKRRF